jgi:predicted RNase H-like nuclease
MRIEMTDNFSAKAFQRKIDAFCHLRCAQFLTADELDRLRGYPHPALIELAAANRRLPYKLSKIGKYWPGAVPGARRENLIKVWAEIIALLDARVQGAAKALPLPVLAARGFELKAFEDALDAVVCAWVGACVMDRKASAFGDDESAIWIPDLSSHPGSLT